MSEALPLTAALQNADGTDNIYVTADASLNKITVTVTNGTGSAIRLPAGHPVPYDQLPAGASAVYLFFDGLLANDEIRNIEMSAAGWTAATFVDPGSTLQYLVIAPDAEVSVGAGDGLGFSLAHVLVSESPTSGTATLSLVGAAGISSEAGSLPLFINIANPPKPPDQPLDTVVDIGFDTPSVYTGHAAELVLHLINQSSGPLVPGGTKSWGANPPTFRLVLLYGDALGALTTISDAAKITGTIDASYGNTWKPVRAELQGGKPHWVMQPDPDGGGTVLGFGDDATIEFRFSGIWASLPAGVDSAITVAHVSWTGIPGYRDGTRYLPIQKLAGPSIVSFSADPGYFGFGQTTLQTVLSWRADHADGVTFEVPGVSNAEEFAPTGSGPKVGGIAAPAGTPLRITAFQNIAGAEKDRDRISATKSLTLAQVARTDVALAIGAASTVALAPGRDVALVFGARDPRFVAVDSVTRKPASPTDLNSLVKPPLQVGGTQSVVVSADGRTLYVAVSPTDLHGGLWLLAFDLETSTLIAQAQVGSTLPSNEALWAATIALTPDGKTVVASTDALKVDGGWTLTTAPHELLVVDAASLTVTGRYAWGQFPQAGPVIGTSPTPSKVVTFVGQGVHAIVGTTDGPELVAALDLDKDHDLGVATAGVLTADRRRMYVLAIDKKTLDEKTGEATAVLALVDIDRDATAFTLAGTIPLGTMQAMGAGLVLASLGLTHWDVCWVALSADESTVYASAVPYIAVIDPVRGTVQPWLMVDPGGIASSATLAVQGETVLATPSDGGGAVLSMISMTPGTLGD